MVEAVDESALQDQAWTVSDAENRDAANKTVVRHGKLIEVEEIDKDETYPPLVTVASATTLSLGSTIRSTLSFETSSDGSTTRVQPLANFNENSIHWDEIKFGAQLYPFRRLAHEVADIYVVARFLELTRLPEIGGESAKLLFKTIKFLHLCDYTMEDICSILAHASSYFLDAWDTCGKRMDPNEVGHVLATLIFLGHCYTQDETCPLKIWHKHLFRKYCTIKTLNSAIMRLLQIRRHILRVNPIELDKRMESLSKASMKQMQHSSRDSTWNGFQCLR